MAAERKSGAYCETRLTESSKFLRIEGGRVGDLPIVLPFEKKHNDTDLMCLEHWLENKRLFQVRDIHYLSYYFSLFEHLR